MHTRRLVYLGLVLLLSMLVLPMATSAQGNSEAAHACQKGGYLDYVDDEGNAFKNTGQCVSYVARGGELVARPFTTIDGTYDATTDTCTLFATSGNFPPGTQVGLEIWRDGAFWFGSIPTNPPDPWARALGSYSGGTEVFVNLVDVGGTGSVIGAVLATSPTVTCGPEI